MRVLLNLLPEEGRVQIRRKYYNRFFFWQSVFLLSITAFYLCLLGSIFYILHENRMSAERAEADRTATQVEAKELGSYEEKFREVNRIAEQANRFDRGHLRWTELFLRLDGLVPDNIAFTSLSTKDYQVFVSGRASSRNDFLELEKRLKGNECFTDYKAPVSNLFSEKDVDFQVDFSVKEECIKGKIRP
jgi:Tfp pilus assembly protein PilN